MRQMTRILISILLGLSLPLMAWAVGPKVTAACKLSWVPPANSHLMDLAGYQIFYSQTAGTYPTIPQATVLASVASVPCVDMKLTVPGQYYVMMTSINAKGQVSSPSAEMAFELVPPSSPCPPTGTQVWETLQPAQP